MERTCAYLYAEAILQNDFVLFNPHDISELIIRSFFPCSGCTVDTVGFIQKLPTQLVAAFRATLEEVIEADVILHVVDYSCKMRDAQLKTVEDVLKSLGVGDKPTIQVWNKIDLVEENPADIVLNAAMKQRTVAVSAKTNQGRENLSPLSKLSHNEMTDAGHGDAYNGGRLGGFGG